MTGRSRLCGDPGRRPLGLQRASCRGSEGRKAIASGPEGERGPRSSQGPSCAGFCRPWEKLSKPLERFQAAEGFRGFIFLNGGTVIEAQGSRGSLFRRPRQVTRGDRDGEKRPRM